MFEVNQAYQSKDISKYTYMVVNNIIRQDEIMSVIEVTWYTGAKTFDQILSIRTEYYSDWTKMSSQKRYNLEAIYFSKD